MNTRTQRLISLDGGRSSAMFWDEIFKHLIFWVSTAAAVSIAIHHGAHPAWLLILIIPAIVSVEIEN